MGASWNVRFLCEASPGKRTDREHVLLFRCMSVGLVYCLLLLLSSLWLQHCSKISLVVVVNNSMLPLVDTLDCWFLATIARITTTTTTTTFMGWHCEIKWNECCFAKQPKSFGRQWKMPLQQTYLWHSLRRQFCWIAAVTNDRLVKPLPLMQQLADRCSCFSILFILPLWVSKQTNIFSILVADLLSYRDFLFQFKLEITRLDLFE